MNTSLLVGLAIGGIVAAVFFKAQQVVKATAETIDRRVRRTLPGWCADCGTAELAPNGCCATCGSRAVWNPGSLDLPAQPWKSKHADVIERAMARNQRARSGMSTEVIQ